MTPLCQLGDPEYLGSSVGSVSPPMWGGSVLDQYSENEEDIPSYVGEIVKDNRRRNTNLARVKYANILIFSLFKTLIHTLKLLEATKF